MAIFESLECRSPRLSGAGAQELLVSMLLPNASTPPNLDSLEQSVIVI